LWPSQQLQSKARALTSQRRPQLAHPQLLKRMPFEASVCTLPSPSHHIARMSRPPFPFPYTDQVRLALDPSEQLPRELHLGTDGMTWTNGNVGFYGHQGHFRRLTQDELRQLMRRLQAAPRDHVIFLDLGGQCMGDDMLREMLVIIKELKALQFLHLNGT
jgi:hypothetical protein